MKKVLMDVEVFPNCFLCGIKDFDTKKTTVWEISERKNDFDKIYDFFINFKGFMISFNGCHYDNPVILYLLQHGHNFNNGGLLTDLKIWSDRIIKEEFLFKDKSLHKYKYHNKWTDVDLYLYWSKMIRLSRKISLKGLAVQMGYSVIQELPFHPDMSLDSSQIDKLIEYNSVHDLGILEMLLIKMEDEVKLRSYIKKTYGLSCMSMDAPKIASEILLDVYCKAEKKNAWETRGLRFEEGKKLPLEPIEFKLDCFKKLYKEMSNASRDFSKTIVLIKNETALKISYGIGGIHSINKNEHFEEDEHNEIITSDIQSLYPNVLINYGLFRFPSVLKKYSDVKLDRVQAKKDGVKVKDEFLKLILNSTSGLIDMSHSWLYYPEGAMKLRLMGQLILTKTIEELVLNNFKVISVNTDGIEAIVPKTRKQDYYNIVDKIGNSFNLIYEHENYKQIVYQNVNSYIAETYNTKKPVKQKGFFLTNPPLGYSVNSLVIPKALIEYYTKGIAVEDFIKNHKEIDDFCISQKVDKSYSIQWTSPKLKIEKLQRLNRFYASKKGGYIFKVRDNKQSHLLSKSGVMIYNKKLNNFPDDINYDYYINEANDIISQLKNHGQISLF